MAHIIIYPSLSAAIEYHLFLNPPKFAEVSPILEPANSTRTDYSTWLVMIQYFYCTCLVVFGKTIAEFFVNCLPGGP